MASFSWAMSVFGVEQMTNVLSPLRAADALQAVARSAEGELGPELRSAFQTGDRLQRAVVDLSFGLVGLGLWPCRRCGGAPGAMAGDPAAGGTGLLSQAGNLGVEILQVGVDAVRWMTGSVWQQQQGAIGWGSMPPPPVANLER
jgi:hypothetical protein